MPVVEKDWIAEPLEVLQYLFEQNSESDPTWGVPKYFAEKISKHGLQGVPSLNSIPPWNIPRGSLVRFRCMIQDMFDPEYYLMVYETTNPADKTATVHCGRYTDISHHPPSHAINFDSPKNITEERQTFYCIPLPGETAWAKAAFDSSAAEMEVETTPVRKSKTKRKMATDCDKGPGMQVMNPCSEDSMEMDSPSPVREAADTHLVPTEKASCELQPAQKRQNELVSEPLFSSQPTSSPPTHHLNFPLPGETGPACLVKLYQGAEDFKLNDAIEVIGVLSVDPMLVHHP